MLQDVCETSKPVGLDMHLGKTKVMCNSVVNKRDISIKGRKIKEVDSYIYLRQMVTKDHDQEQELRCRIHLGCTAFEIGLHYVKQKHTTEVENESAQ